MELPEEKHCEEQPKEKPSIVKLSNTRSTDSKPEEKQSVDAETRMCLVPMLCKVVLLLKYFAFWLGRKQISCECYPEKLAQS